MKQRSLASFSCFDLYGAGRFGRQIAELLGANGFEIRYVYDRSPSESISHFFSEKYGIEALGADQMSRGPHDIPVLNCCFNAGVSCRDIMTMIQKNGRFALPPAIYYPEISTHAKSWNYWLDDAPLLKLADADVKQVRAWLEDEKSKHIWDDLCRFRLGDWMSEPLVDPSKQYFPLDLSFPYENGLRMVDMGACIGDAMLNAVSEGITITRYLGFEPDQESFDQLKVEVARCMDPEDAILLDLGAADTASTVNFTAGNNSSSRIMQNRDLKQSGACVKISTTNLDSIIPSSFLPNLIKMDIEGYELKALSGSLVTIDSFKPVIAMAAYHNSLDLISYMDYVMSTPIFSGYRWYLRQHGWNSLESVVYAIHES